MAKPAPIKLRIDRIQNLSPNLRRFVLTGSSLKGFPEESASGYVKLVFENPEGGQPLMRSITVVNMDTRAQELTLDIALHNQNSPEKLGPAGKWVANAKPGQDLLVAGPGDTKLVDFTADWFFMSGDMTALPAIRANLQRMPDSARGYVVLEIPHQDDKYALDIPAEQIPEGIEIHWLVNPEPGSEPSLIKNLIKKLEWLPGTPYIWAAGELRSVLDLRSHLNIEMPKPRPARYISSYWQKGLANEEHKQEKKRRLTE